MLRAAACVWVLVVAGACGSAFGQCTARWFTESAATAFNNEVRDFVEWNGGLVAVGRFTQVAGQPTQGVAFWNGANWAPIGPAASGTVNRRSAVNYNGTLVVDGQVLSNGQWRALGTGLVGSVNALAVYNGSLYAGGAFTTPAASVVRFNGTTWQSIGALGGTVLDLAVYDNHLVACGSFPAVQSGTPANIAQWDGAAWTGFPPTTFPSMPRQLGVAAGQLFVTGYASLYGYVKSFSGSVWQDEFTAVNIEPAGFAEYAGAVYVGAGTTFGVRRDGQWSQTEPYLNASGYPTSYAVIAHDGALFVGGYFTSVGGLPAANLGRYYVPTADFNRDGDTGTDQDIEAFFACLGGNCCAQCPSADIDGDGEVGADSDIEFFFRVLGGHC